MFDSTFKIDGREFEIEWEMDGGIPVWNIVGEDACNAPNESHEVQDKIATAVHEYMEDWYRGMDEYDG